MHMALCILFTTQHCEQFICPHSCDIYHLQDSGFLDGAFQSQNAALGPLSRLLYDELVKSILRIVEKLDLSVHKVTTGEEVRCPAAMECVGFHGKVNARWTGGKKILFTIWLADVHNVCDIAEFFQSFEWHVKALVYLLLAVLIQTQFIWFWELLTCGTFPPCPPGSRWCSSYPALLRSYSKPVAK